MQLRFLSTLSLRRATCYIIFAQAVTNISIHALLAESDNVACGYWHKLRNFYPRSPCGERPSKIIMRVLGLEFLSTLSLRRATKQAIAAEQSARISIHALLAESDRNGFAFVDILPISIHALLAESDLTVSDLGKRYIRISIHALLAESDILGNPCAGCPAISIHALLAESDYLSNNSRHFLCQFLSTLSLRRATVHVADPVENYWDFYPRSPCGERHRAAVVSQRPPIISIHALLAESDQLSTK